MNLIVMAATTVRALDAAHGASDGNAIKDLLVEQLREFLDEARADSDDGDGDDDDG